MNESTILCGYENSTPAIIASSSTTSALSPVPNEFQKGSQDSIINDQKVVQKRGATDNVSMTIMYLTDKYIQGLT